MLRWTACDRLNASHKKVLESPKELHDLREAADRQRFAERARAIERLRTLFVMALIVALELSLIGKAFERGSFPDGVLPDAVLKAI